MHLRTRGSRERITGALAFLLLVGMLWSNPLQTSPLRTPREGALILGARENRRGLGWGVGNASVISRTVCERSVCPWHEYSLTGGLEFMWSVLPKVRQQCKENSLSMDTCQA
jgi:hypothetical protein